MADTVGMIGIEGFSDHAWEHKTIDSGSALLPFFSNFFAALLVLGAIESVRPLEEGVPVAFRTWHQPRAVSSHPIEPGAPGSAAIFGLVAKRLGYTERQIYRCDAGATSC